MCAGNIFKMDSILPHSPPEGGPRIVSVLYCSSLCWRSSKKGEIGLRHFYLLSLRGVDDIVRNHTSKLLNYEDESINIFVGLDISITSLLVGECEFSFYYNCNHSINIASSVVENVGD